MKPSQKRDLIDELAWHCSNPPAALEVLTEDEITDILKRGHVTKELWSALAPRLQDHLEVIS